MDRFVASCPICDWVSEGTFSVTEHLNSHSKHDLIQLLLQQQKGQSQTPLSLSLNASFTTSSRSRKSQSHRNSTSTFPSVSPIPSTSKFYSQGSSKQNQTQQYKQYEVTISNDRSRSRSSSPCNSNRFHPPSSSQSLTTLKPVNPLSIKSDGSHSHINAVEYEVATRDAEEEETQHHFDLVPVCSFSVPLSHDHDPEAHSHSHSNDNDDNGESCHDVVLVHSYADTTEASIGPHDLEIELEETRSRHHLVQEESDNATSQTSIIKYIIDQTGKGAEEEPERWILPDGRAVPVYSSFTQVRVVSKPESLGEEGNLVASFNECNDKSGGSGSLQLNLFTDEEIPPRGEISEFEESNTSSFLSEDSNLRTSNFIIDTRRLSPAIGDHEGFSPNKQNRRRTSGQSGFARQYLCYECPTMQRFKSLFELIGHKVKVHPASKESFSNIGSATFLPSSKFPVSLKYLIDENIISMKEETPPVVEEKLTLDEKPQPKEYFCVYCSFVCKNKKTLSHHISTEHQDKPENPSIFECNTCGKTFPARTNLRKHLLVHKERKHICTTCSKGFTSNFKLSEHIRVHTKVYPYKCSVCEKAYRTPSLLNHHMKTIHAPPSEKPNKPKVEYYCGQCHKILRSKRSYMCHLQVHLEKPKKCNFCCETFIRQSVLVRHIRVTHNPQFESTESKDCPVCHKKLHPNSMIKHMRIHENQKPYSCQVCGKNFRTYANLTSHSWSHTNVDKPFKCRICPKSYLFKKTLEHHMMVHKRRTLHFVCNECGVKFTHKVNMKRHLEEHYSEKKYKCKTCGKAFQRNYYLLEHERIHSGLKPFLCNICGKASTTKSNHRAHIKIHDARDAGSQEG